MVPCLTIFWKGWALRFANGWKICRCWTAYIGFFFGPNKHIGIPIASPFLRFDLCFTLLLHLAYNNILCDSFGLIVSYFKKWTWEPHNHHPLNQIYCLLIICFQTHYFEDWPFNNFWLTFIALKFSTAASENVSFIDVCFRNSVNLSYFSIIILPNLPLPTFILTNTHISTLKNSDNHPIFIVHLLMLSSWAILGLPVPFCWESTTIFHLIYLSTGLKSVKSLKCQHFTGTKSFIFFKVIFASNLTFGLSSVLW